MRQDRRYHTTSVRQQLNASSRVRSRPRTSPTPAHLNSTPIGVEAAGQKLIVLDGSNNAFEIGTASGATALPGLNNASSAVGVREANSGFSDAYFVVGQFGTTAGTKDAMVGPLVTLEVALASSGLQLTTINSFFNSSAEGDLVLFSANDGLSDDMYVVTSHTVEQLWNTTGFFGPDVGGGPPLLRRRN
jgi:hypothetical protein